MEGGEGTVNDIRREAKGLGGKVYDGQGFGGESSQGPRSLGDSGSSRGHRPPRKFEGSRAQRPLASAPYRGRGGSVKKKSGDDSTNGEAYKIYGCGIYIEDETDANTKKIIVPLESVIILPR